MRRPAAALTLALLSLGLLPAAGAAQTLLIDRVVVRVNDRIATMVDFERQLSERKQALANDPALSGARRQEALDNAGREVLTDIYQELLLLSRADQLGARITEADVDKAIAQTRERMGLESDQQFQQALVAGGLSEAALRDRLRQSLLVQEVMGREVQPRLRVEEEELRRFYREHPADFTVPAAVRLSELVVLEEGRDPQAVGASAATLRAEILGGAAIEDVARKGAAAGTTTPLVDLGWVNAGDLDRELEKAAWDLQPGGVTAPVPGRGGLHLVKLLERRAAALRPFDEIKEQIAARLQQTQMAKEYQTYLRELETRSYIALKVPPEAEGFTGLGAQTEAPDALQGLRELAPAKPAPKPAAPAPPAGPAPKPAATPTTPPG
jgi:parvulin-like peptidyl-prolyl isomerase